MAQTSRALPHEKMSRTLREPVVRKMIAEAIVQEYQAACRDMATDALSADGGDEADCDIPFFAAIQQQIALANRIVGDDSIIAQRVWQHIEQHDCVTFEDVQKVGSEHISFLAVELNIAQDGVEACAERAVDRLRRALHLICCDTRLVTYGYDFPTEAFTVGTDEYVPEGEFEQWGVPNNIGTFGWASEMEARGWEGQDEQRRAWREVVQRHRDKHDLLWRQRNIFVDARCVSDSGIPFQLQLCPSEDKPCTSRRPYRDDMYDEYHEVGWKVSIRALCSKRRCGAIREEVEKTLKLLWPVMDQRDQSEFYRIADEQGLPPGAKVILPVAHADLPPAAVWATAFELIWSRHKGAHVSRSVQNALEFIRLSNAAEQPAVRVMLSMAGLESLLCSGPTDITKSVARRSAFLLAPSAAERPRWRDRFAALYTRRSKFVHGTMTELRSDEAECTAVWLNEVLRALLHLYQYMAATDAGPASIPELPKVLRMIDNDLDAGKELPTGFVARPDLEKAVGLDDV